MSLLSNSTTQYQKATSTPVVKRRSNRIKQISMAVLLLVVLIAGGSVFYLLNRQQETDFSTAPTEPLAAPVAGRRCVVGFVVPETTRNISCIKQTYLDELDNTAGNYNFRNLYNPSQPLRPGDRVVFRIALTNGGSANTQISVTDVLNQNNLQYLEFVDSTCGASAFNAQTRTLTCPGVSVTPNQNPAPFIAFRVRVATNTPNNTTIRNVASITDVTTPTVTASCETSIAVSTPTGAALQCVKNSYANAASNTAGNYTLSTPQTSFRPGDTVVFQVPITNTGTVSLNSVQLTDVLTNNNLNLLTFLDSNCATGSYNASSRTLSCTLAQPLAVGSTSTIIFRAQIASNAADNTSIRNNATVVGQPQSGNSVTDECSILVTVDTNEVVTPIQCGDTCSASQVCPQYHSCNPATNRCALSSCLQSGATCTGNLCEHVSNPPTSRICNENCTNNSDCRESQHICYQGKCRLATNPNSASCSPPQDNVVYYQQEDQVIYTLPNSTQQVVITKGGQPVLPEELPVAGADNIIALVAGSALLVVSGLVFLLML